MAEQRAWWKEAVVYQIYPRSFNDTDGDGIGDIPGIVEKADYLEYLGVDVVWLCPVYESPNADNGYDVSDYRAIMDEFGTMDDWERLLAELHDRDIRLVMDLVANHTSDEHEWFVRSRASTDSDYRDWYYWREGDTDAEGNPVPPNNWESFFGGPAWEYDEATGEWYLHLFDVKQPDLNWRNPDVRAAIFDMMEFWLDKGIDGFRLDVINLLSKPKDLPDGEAGPFLTGAEHFVNGPLIHEYISEIYEEVLADYDCMTVGEMVDVSVGEAKEYLLPDGDGLSMLFNFDHMRLDHGPEGRWDVVDWELVDLKAVLTRWQDGLDEEWNSLYFGNHDQPRPVSRFGDDDQYRRESAKLLATLLHTLRGTPYVYQGEEIGMTNYPFESLAEVDDVDTIDNVRIAREEGLFDDDAAMMAAVRRRSRDNARTPVQWDDSPQAGFTDGEPWLAVNPNYEEINIERARGDPDSVLEYYRELIALRADHPVLVYGDYELLVPDHESIYAYTRTLQPGDVEGIDDRARLLVVLNVSGERPRFELPDRVDGGDADLLIGNYDDTDGATVDGIELRPWEARIHRLE